MTRTRALCLVLAITGWTGAAHAVALGEIEVTSYLNQKVAATIPVTTNKPGELEGATVGLASNEEFERAGLERSDFLSSLRFEVKETSIKVTSKDIAREPFLTVLLDVRWVGGRLLREYTILLDLPPGGAPTSRPRAAVVEPAAPAPAPSAETSPAGTEPAQSQMAPAESAPAPSAAPAPIASSSGGTYGPTAPQETLWSIAYKLRPDTALTMDQVQVALYNANPQAFDHGRINGLMKNQVLRVPTADEIRAVNPATAKAQVAAARSGGSMPAPAPRPRPAPKAEVTPEPAPAPAPTYVPPPAPKVAEAPKPEPKPEPKVTPPAPKAAEPTPPPSSSVPPPASTLPQAKPEPAPVAVAPEPKPEPAPPPAPEAARPKPAPAPVARIEGPSFVSGLLDSAKDSLPIVGPVVGLLAFLIIGILGYRKIGDLIAKRKYDRASRKAAEPAPAAPGMDDDDATAVAATESPSMPMADETPTLIAASAGAPVAATQVMAAQTLQQTMQSTSQGLQQTFQQTQVSESPAATTGGHKVDFDVTGNFANETVQINLDAGDPVSEAEFHRAYGLYDEAALLLKQALQKDPTRKDARIKLAEIYFEASKANEFVEVAKELKGQLSESEWQPIALLGTQIAPGNELFAGGAGAVTGAVDLSFDEPAAPAATAAAAPAAAPASPAADSGLLDFKLDDIQLDMPAAPPAAAAPAAPAEGGLEFDLGSLSMDTPAAAPAPVAEPAPAAAPSVELNLSEFDLGADAPASDPAEISMDLPVDAPGDESSTKLDLARAYIDMGDNDMAKSLLDEVVAQGNPQQKNEAQELLKRVPG